MFPRRTCIQIYLLHEIDTRGGRVPARSQEVYLAVAKHFGELTAEDLNVWLPKGVSKWGHEVDFTRYDLAKMGEIDQSIAGSWVITEKGRSRLATEWPPASAPEYTRPRGQNFPVGRRAASVPISQPAPSSAPAPPAPVSEVLRPLEPGIRQEVLERLAAMSDSDFEDFVGRVLVRLGYEDVNVVGRSGDRGLDIECIHSLPLVEPPVRVAVQVKRHAGTVGGSVVGDLRGRHGYSADRLILVNLGGFSAGAREEAYQPDQPGAKPVKLISGEDLADLMACEGIGIRREPVVRESVDETFFSPFAS